MKHCFLYVLATVLVCLSSSPSFSQTNIEPRAVVVKLDALDGDRLMKIHSAAKSDPSIDVLNSCEQLSLIVFGTDVISAVAEERVRVFLSALELENFEIQDGVTATEVMIHCRQAMRDALYPEGIID